MNAWILVSLIAFAWAGWQGWRGTASYSWPAVPGRILSIVITRSSQKHLRRVRVEYEYQVAGETYRGKRLRYGDLGNVRGEEAADYARSFVPGAPIDVHHHPTRPSVAVLVPGFDRQNLFLSAGVGIASIAYSLYRSL